MAVEVWVSVRVVVVVCEKAGGGEVDAEMWNVGGGAT